MYLLPRMMLLLLLSAGTSQAVREDWLAGIVRSLRRVYRISGQFCVAANIPAGQDPNTLDQVLDPYTADVEETLRDGDAYVGNTVVIAKPVGPVHAEPQVLKNLQTLVQNRQGHVLVIYSYLSPCSKCTGPRKGVSITGPIRNNVVNRWSEYAFVFTTLFTQPGFSLAGQSGSRGNDELKQSLTDLASSGLGLGNIFRCYQPPNLEFQCYSCSSRGRVSNVCVDENAQPGQGGSSSSRSSSSDRSRSSSSSSDRGRASGSKKRPRIRTQSESSSGSNRGRNRRWSSSRSSSRSSRSSSRSRGGRRSSRSSSRGSRNRSRRRSSSFGGGLV